MRIVRNALLAGSAALMLSGVFAFAAAQDPSTHVMTVRLPGGGVEQIRYSGDIPPKVVVDPFDDVADVGSPVGFFDPYAPFAAMERISAQMDQQMAAMMREANAVAANPAEAMEIDAGKLPPGAQSYSFVSNMNGNMFCARSVEITSRGDHQKPQVVSRSYGNCGNGHDVTPRIEHTAPVTNNSDVREIRYLRQAPGKAVIREASAAQS